MKKKRKKMTKAAMEAKNLNRKEKIELFDSDDTFSFIVGYTSGGAPFGIRWDEEELDTKEIHQEYTASVKEFEDDDILPF